MYVIEQSLLMTLAHLAENRPVNRLLCQCGEQIAIIITPRAVRSRQAPKGNGEMRSIGEIFCPSCQEIPRTRYGQSIFRDELIQIRIETGPALIQHLGVSQWPDRRAPAAGNAPRQPDPAA